MPETATQAPVDPQTGPLIEQLHSLQSMRQRLEQDWSDYLNHARANTGNQPRPASAGAEVGVMRQQVTHQMERMEDRFRCLDVDMDGNQGNVVLICGDNNGAAFRPTINKRWAPILMSVEVADENLNDDGQSIKRGSNCWLYRRLNRPKWRYLHPPDIIVITVSAWW